jgi:hypothetical protein
VIVFDLRCANGHVFEAWFRSSADYAEQAERGLVACPSCETRDVAKAVMCPAVPMKSNRQPGFSMRELAVRLHQLVQRDCDYVGADFAQAARSRHESPDDAESARGIWGEASVSEVADLLSDGIMVLPLPPVPREDA